MNNTEYWQRVDAESILFARREHRRRLAVRAAADITPAFDPDLVARLGPLIECYAREMTTVETAVEYDGARLMEVTKILIKALLLRRDMLSRYPRLQKYGVEITSSSPDPVIRVFHLLDEAVKHFREIGARHAAMLEVDKDDLARDGEED